MLYEDLHYLPHKISCPETAAKEFKIAFNSKESEEHEGIVYFFLSEKPIPRVLGESRILYIGKTNKSLHKRYHRHSKKLSSNRSGAFYRHVIKNYGAISFGYLLSEDPESDERKYFRDYFDRHLEYPPKSKIG